MTSVRGIIAIAVFFAGTAQAWAAPPAEEARAAYERGSRAFQAHDFAVAAREFARADAIVPSDAAIEAALETSLRAGDPVLGMELVDRARARALDTGASRAATRVAAAFSTRVGRLVFPCQGATTCRAFVDGVEIERPRAPVVVMPGPHAVRVVREDRVREVRVEVAPESRVEVAAPEDARTSGASTAGVGVGAGVVGAGAVTPDAPPRVNDAGPVGVRTSTIVGSTTGVLTLLLGGATALSYVDLRSKRADFDRGACGLDASPTATPLPDCDARAKSGRSAEVRTAIFATVTAVTALTTAAVFIFRPWGAAGPTAQLSVTGTPNAVAAGFSVQERIP